MPHASTLVRRDRLITRVDYSSSSAAGSLPSHSECFFQLTSTVRCIQQLYYNSMLRDQCCCCAGCRLPGTASTATSWQQPTTRPDNLSQTSNSCLLGSTAVTAAVTDAGSCDHLIRSTCAHPYGAPGMHAEKIHPHAAATTVLLNT